MDSQEIRPDVAKVLRGLKDFQRKSVNYVFRRLYKDSNKTNRFLIADEVGLGKTLVAKGVIAKSIDYLWDSVKRIDVIYICSNREIANQNISRLKISDEQFAAATRITLLPLKIKNIKSKRLNFISFTPGTSFDLYSKTGIVKERALIYHILKDGWGLKGTAPINLFQDRASKESWRSFIKDFSKYYEFDNDLAQEFLIAIDRHIKKDKLNGKVDLKTRFLNLCDKFKFYRENIPLDDRIASRSIIGKLRMILAQSCLDALEPDIIILDEFQRFKYLLDVQSEIGRLAKHLFNYKSKEIEKTKIILISATPYKMYTLHQEEDIENHYEDFIRTIKFLLDSEEKTRGFKEKLKQLRNEFFNVRSGNFERLKELKKPIENELRRIMIRTERLAQTDDRNGMVNETSKAFCSVTLEELENFSALDRLSQKIGAGDVIEYWKSAPYILSLMDDYELKQKFKAVTQKDHVEDNLFKLIKQNVKRTLRWETISSFKRIVPANAKLRAFMENVLDVESWRMLWIPPSLPYYKPYGSFRGRKLQKFTKNLIFSSWRIVPKAISMLCSYEAERRMVTQYRYHRSNYREERKRRKPLLVFPRKEDKLGGMGNLSLLFPCLTLAIKIDPLEISLELASGGNQPSYTEVKKIVRYRINELLDKAIGQTQEKGSLVDKRWYWASLALLDRYFYRDSMEAWLNTKEEDLKWEGVIKPKGEEDADIYFKQHADNFRNCFINPEKLELGKRPRKLVDVLTKLAMASPAVVALRGLFRLRGGKRFKPSSHILKSAALIAAGFRILYNLPESITLIRSINEKEPYWERVLEYGISGNLQAVMDEYVHILRESLGLIDSPFDETVMKIAEEVFAAASLRTIALDFDDIDIEPGSQKIGLNRQSIRCRFALRFGEGKSEGDDEITREGQVRAAFNSPFRPFILASTSIGQEGLDFHQYCHSICHWNLPPNPVDLEQREGRIHRYKGHVIRKNIAKHFGLKKLRENRYEMDPWAFLFKQAVIGRPKKKDDIVPFWVFETKNGYKIERHIPCLPLSRDIERLKELKDTLVAYRMVFGQPRQEDLVEFLKRFMGQEEMCKEIKNFQIDLSPR